MAAMIMEAVAMRTRARPVRSVRIIRRTRTRRRIRLRRAVRCRHRCRIRRRRTTRVRWGRTPDRWKRTAVGIKRISVLSQCHAPVAKLPLVLQPRSPQLLPTLLLLLQTVILKFYLVNNKFSKDLRRRRWPFRPAIVWSVHQRPKTSNNCASEKCPDSP
uniref:(northern house mosquito) hypothetical protein n=1 Tax=Culex pipiens TaxID=7175 RepID=A0A8D8EW19_CULPI